MRNLLLRLLFVTLLFGVLFAPDRWPPADEHAAHAKPAPPAPYVNRPAPPAAAPEAALQVATPTAVPTPRGSIFSTGTETFEEDFSDLAPIGNPPVPWTSSVKWDTIVHSRDPGSWNFLQDMLQDTPSGNQGIHHGPNCEAPDAQASTDFHDGGTAPLSPPDMPYADAMFLCRDHLMTAVFAGGYGLVYQVPTRLLQIPADGSEAVVRVDISTFQSSSRDWIDLWLTPWDSNIPAPFNVGQVDLAGAPANGITFRMDPGPVFNTYFMKPNSSGTPAEYNMGGNWFLRIDDHFRNVLGRGCTVGTPGCVHSSGLSKSVRDTFEIRISKTRIKFWMPDLVNQSGVSKPLVFIDKAFSSVPALGITELPWDQLVMTFGHHSYNPVKACVDTGRPASQCPPNTWHWDEFYMSPATAQFTTRHSTQRAYTFGTGVAQTITFDGPSPANSYLRLNMHGVNTQVSVNGGADWAPLRRQPSMFPDTDPSVFGRHRPYWHAIPEGITSVQVKGQAISGFPGLNVNYATIWSETTNTDVPPTFTPTPTPEVTSTPTLTFTPTSTPTPTNTPTATPTPVPTSTPLPDLTVLVDDFDDNDTDPARWSIGNLYSLPTTGYTVAETGQEVRITPPDTSDVRASGYRSASNFNLTGRSAHVHVKAVASQAGGNNGIQTAMIVGPDASNWFRMVTDNGQLFCSTNTADTETIRYQTTYSASTHAWWRIRELDGDFYCDTAQDADGAPATWVNRARFTRPAWDLTGVKIELHVLNYVTVASASAARLDGFNTTDTLGEDFRRPRRGGLTGVE